MVECKRCMFTDDIAVIGNIQCNYCDLHDQLVEQNKTTNFSETLQQISESKISKYDCIIGISGGLDSSTLLFSAVTKWGLTPLVIHFNNHWNTDVAKKNMEKLIQKLNVDFIEFYVNKLEFDNINKSFLKAGLPDGDIPNDIAMTKLIYDTAEKYDIKYILNGHCYKTEGSTPKKWTYMDAKYIESVYRKFYHQDLINYPLFTFADQIKYSLLNIKQIRPYHYNDVNREVLDKEMIEYIGWENYGWKHGENMYTDFIGSYLLPRKFGIDKRLVYLSARIRTNKITKKEALKILNIESNFDTSLIGDEYIELINSDVGSRDDYDKYDFHKYKWIIFYLYITQAVPYTFYKKYSTDIDINCNDIDELSVNNIQQLIKHLKEDTFEEDVEMGKTAIISKLQDRLSNYQQDYSNNYI